MDHDLFAAEHVDQRIIRWHDDPECAARSKVALNVGFGDRNLSHVVAFNLLKESGKSS